MATDRDRDILNSIFNPNLPLGSQIEEPEQIFEESIEEETEAIVEAKRLEVEGVRAAENRNLIGALECFNKAIDICPERASGYNNRAQALRLQGYVEDALKDLNNAIQLSQGKGKAASQAYTQRGLIYKLKGEDEQALEDFQRAACLGSEFAKTQVVQLNPYSAMCNKMLVEVIDKLKRGEEDDDDDATDAL